MDWIWIPQLLAAFSFLFFAYAHGIRYERTRARGVAWLGAIGPRGARVLATLEAMGALGLILPMATQTLPWLTPVAALCLLLLMLFAIVFHSARREWPNLALNGVLGGLAAIVAYGRWALLGS